MMPELTLRGSCASTTGWLGTTKLFVFGGDFGESWYFGTVDLQI